MRFKENRCSIKVRLGKHLTVLAANSSRFGFEVVAMISLLPDDAGEAQYR